MRGQDAEDFKALQRQVRDINHRMDEYDGYVRKTNKLIETLYSPDDATYHFDFINSPFAYGYISRHKPTPLTIREELAVITRQRVDEASKRDAQAKEDHVAFLRDNALRPEFV